MQKKISLPKPYTIYYDYKNRWWVLSNRITKITGFRNSDDALKIIQDIKK